MRTRWSKSPLGATLDANAAHSSGKAYLLTDVLSGAEWSYDGYGFRLISAKGPAYGILNLFLDGVQITTVDLYAAALTNAAVLSTQQNVAFGRHRVGVFFSGNKNAASTNTQVIADAIEVMI